MKKITLILSIICSAFMVNAQEQKTSKFEIAKIKTSAQCGMCKTKIEETLVFEKGVKSAVLDMETKILTVKFKKDKTNLKALELAINKIGYDANDSPADKKAYEKLEACCQKGE